MTEDVFLLNLADNEIVLERFAKDPSGTQGWFREGSVSFVSPDLGSAVAGLREKAASGKGDLPVFVNLPKDQVKVLSLPQATVTPAEVATAFEGATPYSLDQLRLAWVAQGGQTAAAAVALETLQEAEDFLAPQGFQINGYLCVPGAEWAAHFANFGSLQDASGAMMPPAATYTAIAALAPPAPKPAPPKPPKAPEPEKPDEKSVPATVVTTPPAKETASKTAASAPAEPKPVAPAKPAAPATVAKPLPAKPAAPTPKAAIASPPKGDAATLAALDAAAQKQKRDRRKKLIPLLLTALLLIFLLSIAALAATAGRDRIASWFGFAPQGPTIFAEAPIVGNGLSDDDRDFTSETPSIVAADRIMLANATPSIDFPSRLPRETALPEPLPLIYEGGEAITLNAPNDPLAGRNLVLEAALSSVLPSSTSADQNLADLRRYASTGIWTIPPTGPNSSALSRSPTVQLASIDPGIQPFERITLPPVALQQPDTSPGVGERFVAEPTSLAGIATAPAAAQQNAETQEQPSQTEETVQTNLQQLPNTDDNQLALAASDGDATDPTQPINAADLASAALSALVETGDVILGRPDVVPPSRDLTGATVFDDGIRVTFAAPDVRPLTRPALVTPAALPPSDEVLGDNQTSVTPSDENTDLSVEPEETPETETVETPEAEAENQAEDPTTAEIDDGPGFGLAPETSPAPELRPGSDAAEATDPEIDTENLAVTEEEQPEPVLPSKRPQLRPEGINDLSENSTWSPTMQRALAKVRPAGRPRGLKPPVEPKAEEPKPEVKPEPEIAEPKPEAKPEPEKPDTSSAENAAAVAAAAAAAAAKTTITVPKPAAVASKRPSVRPRSVERQAARAAAAAAAPAKPSSNDSGGSSTSSSRKVTVARSNEIARPSGTAPRTVQRNATVANAVNLRRINLMGISGTKNSPKALVRMPNGKFITVKVGDRLDGGRVSSIGNNQLRYVKGGRNITLKMPRI